MCPNYYAMLAFSNFSSSWLFHFDIFILCKIFHCLFPSSTCAVESWVEREAFWSVADFWHSSFLIWKQYHVTCMKVYTVYQVFPAWMKYCFQLCSDMKRNSVSLTSPAYFNPNFVGYDTVAVYRHFVGIFSCQQVTLKCWKPCNLQHYIML